MSRRISPLAIGAAVLALFLTTGNSISGQSLIPSTALELRIAPQDTSLNLDAKNYSTQGVLTTYTWPDYRPANAILMKLNMPVLPAGAIIHEAKLHLRLIASDTKADPGYAIAVHKVVGRNPVISRATGYTSDGSISWTTNTCCHKNVPLAQADLSPAYDTQTIDKSPGFKTWTITSLVEEWIANPTTNRGLVLTSDTLALRDRYRYFASMEHSDPSFRPFVAIKYSASIDITPPSVLMANPVDGSVVNGAVAVKADATDNVGVAAVQLLLDGAPFGAEMTAPPYSQTWNTSTMSDGTYTFSATARDSAGNAATAPAVRATVANGVVRLQPQDTSLNVDAVNYSTQPNLWAYTWPDHQPANTILLKFDVPSLPEGASVTEATLHLALVESDLGTEATYTMTAHKIVGRVPVVARATGYTADGQVSWTANGCCSSGVPLAQGDLGPVQDTRAIDKVPGFKTWNVTAIVRDWLIDPASNMGMIVNPDLSTSRDRFRFFASVDHPDPALRPFLHVKYAIDRTAPSVAISAPAAAATVAGTVSVAATASDDVAVAGVQFRLDGVDLGVEDTVAPYAYSWNSQSIANGSHTLTAVARDAAGNVTTSAGVTVNVANDLTAPAVAITAPVNGATVSGNVTIAASASDNVAVAGVQFKLNGANLGAEDNTSPFAVSWSTSTVADGSYTLTAVARDAAGNRTTSPAVGVTIANGVTPPPATGSWPNEPAGYAAISDQPWNALSTLGWNHQNRGASSAISVDSSAPLSASNVLAHSYPVGLPGGVEPAVDWYQLPASFTEGYVAMWWKPSNPWQGHPSGVNKIFFIFGSAGHIIPVMYGTGNGTYELRVAPEWGSWSWLTPNVSSGTVTLGQWHRIEIYFKQNTSGGVIKWWMDGNLIGSYSNIAFPSSMVFQEVQIAPTWGGVGGTKTQQDYFWFDHARISRPSSTSPTPTALFSEGFEDANLAGRGWYDNTSPLLSSTEHIAGSAKSIEYTFSKGATMPSAGSALRRKFTPSDSVYLSYYVKYSTTWVGSQRSYHPHEFHFLTTLDGDWSGLSNTRLTAYIEQNGGTPLVALQDGLNIDQSRIGVNLTSVTENRGVAGCNGSTDGYPDNCYLAGNSYVNEKKFPASSRYFTDTAGPFYKNDWHLVEVFLKLNSISAGKGMTDGVIQYWFDGQPVIDHRNVLFRTGANPTLQFNQLVMAPYIGDGSPVAQSMWIDNLTVAKTRP
jgi:hypothetical protein